SCCAPRRGFLGKMAVLGAAAAMPTAALAQGARKAAPKTRPFRIDVHHHLAYPGYLEEIGAQRAGSAFKWTPEMSLEEMEPSGIAVALLSIIQPGTAVPDAEKARHVARQANEYGAQIVRDHPGRFGSFATLPLADADASLKEIEYGLDTLKAQGIGL